MLKITNIPFISENQILFSLRFTNKYFSFSGWILLMSRQRPLPKTERWSVGPVRRVAHWHDLVLEHGNALERSAELWPRFWSWSPPRVQHTLIAALGLPRQLGWAGLGCAKISYCCLLDSDWLAICLAFHAFHFDFPLAQAQAQAQAQAVYFKLHIQLPTHTISSVQQQGEQFSTLFLF